MLLHVMTDLQCPNNAGGIIIIIVRASHVTSENCGHAVDVLMDLIAVFCIYVNRLNCKKINFIIICRLNVMTHHHVILYQFMYQIRALERFCRLRPYMHFSAS